MCSGRSIECGVSRGDVMLPIRDATTIGIILNEKGIFGIPFSLVFEPSQVSLGYSNLGNELK
jgi:hypothetical protein